MSRPPRAWKSDKTWSDQFIPAIKQIVGPFLLEEADIRRDTKENTDLMILNARDKTIACRVRKHRYYRDFPDQFTIRLARDTGSKTEMEKIMDGFGDWMFYGHSNPFEDGSGFSAWWLIDLAHFRSHIMREKGTDQRFIRGKQSNGDGTHFMWFRISSFPQEPPLLIASNANADPF